MKRTLIIGVCLIPLVAGCTVGPLGSAGSTPTGSESQTPTVQPPSESTPTTTNSPPSPARTMSSPEAAGDTRAINYVIRSGSIPDEFSSVYVTARVVFVDQPADLGPCYPRVFSGPYKPTLTPISTPSGECHRSVPVTVDLTDMTGERSLGNFTAPRTTSGHALLITDLRVERHNGTTVKSIRNIGGAELIRSSNPPEGPYGVELTIETVTDDRSYDYWLVWDRFDPKA